MYSAMYCTLQQLRILIYCLFSSFCDYFLSSISIDDLLILSPWFNVTFVVKNFVIATRSIRNVVLNYNSKMVNSQTHFLTLFEAILIKYLRKN